MSVRGDMCSRKAQLTVFMILGIILFASFLFVIFLTQQVQTHELTQEEEALFTRVFTTDALQLYVETCLQQQIVLGIQQLGQHGIIWEEHGGIVAADERNSVVYGDNPITYGINLPVYADENQYPCDLNDLAETGTCTYTFPEKAQFGTKHVWLHDIEQMLGKYLLTQLESCVHHEALGDLANRFTTSSEGSLLDVSITSPGVGVSVHYPLRLEVAQEEYAALSEFSFFYSVPLHEFLTTLIEEPVNLDTTYVDFPFTRDTVAGQPFTYHGPDCDGPCERTLDATSFNSFRASLQVLRQEDDVYRYRAFLGRQELDGDDGYLFQFVRKNRPPALETIQQCPQEGVDYLVVPGTTMGYGSFVARAYDADEDPVVRYTFEEAWSFANPQEGTGVQSLQFQGGLGEGSHTITATAFDEHGASDAQEIRVRVDEPVIPDVTVTNIVSDILGTENIVSREDPICISIGAEPTRPDGTSVAVTDFAIGSQLQSLGYGKEYAFYGAVEEGCVLDSPSYTIDTIHNSINQQLNLPAGEQPVTFSPHTTVVYGEGGDGCMYNAEHPPVIVHECFSAGEGNPYVEGEFVHIYNEDGTLKEVEDQNPFLANRVCCVDNRVVAGGECFNKDGCFTHPLLRETLTAQCDGTRGNVCGANGAQQKEFATKLILGEERLRCGDPQLMGCGDVPTECTEAATWESIENQGWCYSDNVADDSGCALFCEEGIVDTLNLVQPDGQVYADDPAQFTCGCSDQPNDTPCDNNYDGFFQGMCQEGVCRE